MRQDTPRPLPEPEPIHLPPPPFQDVPLISQQMPEQQVFVDVYRQVGQPRITVFVNRTLEGQIIPVNPVDPQSRTQVIRQSTAGVVVEQRTTSGGWDRRETTDRFESTGPAEYRETRQTYLRPGQYDEVQARSIDYEAIENIMTDWLSANGQVTIISPIMARQRLTDEQLAELQAGRPQALSEVAQQLGADVLVQVQARPTRQTPQGLHVRIIAEAINTQGGESIARAMVDVPPPLEKTTLNRYTRFLARKLMDGMIQTWTAPPPTTAPVN